MTLLRGFLLVALLVACVSAVWTVLSRETPMDQLPRLQVEVLNGSGESLLAQRVAQRLQETGHEVVSVGNAARPDYLRTFGIDRRGKVRWTRALLEQIGPAPLIQERSEGTDADLTLIIGADWADLALLEPGPAGTLRR